MTAVLPKTSRKSVCLYCELIKNAPRVSPQLKYIIRKKTDLLNQYRSVLKESIERAGAILKFAVGLETYPLQGPLSIFYMLHGTQTIAVLQGLPKRCIHGLGGNRAEARQSLFTHMHTEFQRLYKTLPMQRNAADEQLWNALNAVIATERYRRDRTTSLPITASLVATTVAGLEVDWFGGGRLLLPTDILGVEWATLTVGDWFEAVLSRRAADGRIVQATMVRQIPPIEPFTDDEVIAWHSNLPAANLPSSTAE